MSDSESLRMAKLLTDFRSDIISIEESRNAKLFKQANLRLNDVYTYHLSAKKCFAEVEDYLKNIYRSFNYAVAIINEALKKKVSLGSENVEILDECIEAMLTCCDLAIARLTKKK